MIDIDNKADYYILNEAEIKLLLGGCGYDELFAPLKAEEESKRKLVETLAGLYQSKRITSDGEGFVIAEELRKIIDVIGSASKLLKISISAKDEKYYIYIADAAAVCFPLSGHNPGFRLKLADNIDDVARLILDDVSNDLAAEENTNEEGRMWNASVQLLKIELFTNGKPDGEIEISLPFGGGTNMRSEGLFGYYDGEFSKALFEDSLRNIISTGGEK